MDDRLDRPPGERLDASGDLLEMARDESHPMLDRFVAPDHSVGIIVSGTDGFVEQQFQTRRQPSRKVLDREDLIDHDLRLASTEFQ